MLPERLNVCSLGDSSTGRQLSKRVAAAPSGYLFAHASVMCSAPLPVARQPAAAARSAKKRKTLRGGPDQAKVVTMLGPSQPAPLNAGCTCRARVRIRVGEFAPDGSAEK